MEEAVSPVNYLKALQAVVTNDGADQKRRCVDGLIRDKVSYASTPEVRIDGMKAADLEKHLETHWGKIRTKLLAGTYVPTPVALRRRRMPQLVI